MSEYEDLLFAMPERIVDAFASAKRIERLPKRDKIENVIIIGGGSAAIAGSIVAAAAGPFMPVPITIVDSYEIPAFVGEGTLAFALSPTGSTEEAVNAATEAANQGARMVVVSRGGDLGTLAGSWGAPFIRLANDFEFPYQATGVMATSVLSVLETVGLFVGAKQYLQDAADQLRSRIAELREEQNFASDLAEDLAGRSVLLYSSGLLGQAVARRWKAQINAIGKAPAFYGLQPDISHNEVAGWTKGQTSLGGDVVVINLRHDDEHPQIAARYELAGEYLEPHVGAIYDVEANGDGTLAQIFDLLLVGDYVALRLAAASGHNGAPSAIISKLQAALLAN